MACDDGFEGCPGLVCYLGCLCRIHILLGDKDAATGELETVDYTFNVTNVTNFAYGIAANVAAVLLYGSIFVPVKKIEVGDGKHMEVSFDIFT